MIGISCTKLNCENFKQIILHSGTINTCSMHFYTGLRESSEESLINILDNQKGNVAVLMVGGVSEAFKSFPGPYHLILKKRKGFVRVALKTG